MYPEAKSCVSLVAASVVCVYMCTFFMAATSLSRTIRNICVITLSLNMSFCSRQTYTHAVLSFKQKRIWRPRAAL